MPVCSGLERAMHLSGEGEAASMIVPAVAALIHCDKLEACTTQYSIRHPTVDASLVQQSPVSLLYTHTSFNCNVLHELFRPTRS